MKAWVTLWTAQIDVILYILANTGFHSNWEAGYYYLHLTLTDVLYLHLSKHFPKFSSLLTIIVFQFIPILPN